MRIGDESVRSRRVAAQSGVALVAIFLLFGCTEAADSTERTPESDREAEVREPSPAPDETSEAQREFLDDVPQGPAKGDPVLSDSENSDDEQQERPKPKAGQLTAGRWSDIENWEFWSNLFEQGTDGEKAHKWGSWEKRWGLYTRRRIPVRVTRPDDTPAVDTRVILRDESGETIWSTRTDNRGRAELFDGLFGDSSGGSYRIVASSGSGETTSQVDTPSPSERQTLVLPETSEPPAALDLMLVVDTTSSMNDELRYLQSELGDVVERSQKYFGRDLSIRTSVNVYRDKGDDYVVRTHPFRNQNEKAVADLDAEGSAGGGDYPEAVDRALAKSIEEHEWSDRARARLLFLVLDAPPHEREPVISRLHEALRAAAERGIRIVPVAGSGVNKKTEFLLRSIALGTGGTYTFLTDDSGIGGSHIEPTIGDHEVHYLNDLLVTIVHDYIK